MVMADGRTATAALLLLVLLQLPAATHAAGCACDHGTDKLCCGQTSDGGKPTCAPNHNCGEDTPQCAGYINNQHLGECVAASCIVEMAGLGLSCPADTKGGKDTCIVKHEDAQEVCKKTPGCEYIGVCSHLSEGCGSWNGRYPDSVQLGKAPLTRNIDWISCKPGTEPGAPSSDMAAELFVLLLVLIGGVYVGVGVGFGLRSGRPRGKSLLEAHPHHERWREVAGLVSDGLHFAQTRSRRGARVSAAARRQPLLPSAAQEQEPEPAAAGRPKASRKSSSGAGKGGGERGGGVRKAGKSRQREAKVKFTGLTQNSQVDPAV
jgi:hypothetical protein